MLNSVIKINNLSKRYRIGERQNPYKTLREEIMDTISSPLRNFAKLQKLTKFKDDDEKDIIWALKDISLEIEEGEVLGVIGKNAIWLDNGQILKIGKANEVVEAYEKVQLGAV